MRSDNVLVNGSFGTKGIDRYSFVSLDVHGGTKVHPSAEVELADATTGDAVAARGEGNGMIDAAVAGSAPFLPVRLVVFPEFAHAAPVYPTVAELLAHLAVPIPNVHTERLQAKARQYGLYIQSGSMLEADARWPGVVFNTTCLIGPDGIVAKYRKQMKSEGVASNDLSMSLSWIEDKVKKDFHP